LHIIKLIAKNFRNYEDLNISFDTNTFLNIIIAPNGMGKSNFLEAIHYLSYLRPFRNVLDTELIKKGNTSFYLAGNFIDSDLSHEVIIKYQKKKDIFYNNKKIKKHSEIIGSILSVLFSVDDLFIIIGNPLIRRKYFDMFFSIIDKEYMYNLKTYQIILKQKNYLIKLKNRDDLINIYNQQMSKCIDYIQNKRIEFTEEIDKIFQLKYKEVGNFKEKTKILYVPSIKYKDQSDLISKLNENRKKDNEFGFCTIGPHKDNYLFLLNGVNFSKFASFGQIRLAALIIKIIQNITFYKIHKINPILLIDDVILELDKERQRNFIDQIIGNNQIFITIANKDNIPYLYDKSIVREIRINNGKYE
jgi:DNA replication and repair protein RecF